MEKFSRVAATTVLALGGLCSLAAELPGTMVYDSYVQLLEGRSGHYAFWHPPVMSWLLGLADGILPGTAFFVLLQTLIGFGTLIALIWTARRVSLLAVFVAVLFAFTPQLLMFQGYVLKDVFFADTVTAGFVAIAMAARFWDYLDARAGYVLLSAIFLAVAILARQNGIVFLPFAAIALGLIVWFQGMRGRTALLTGAVYFMVICIAVFAANVAFGMYHGGEKAATDQFKVLRIYDLAAMRHHDPALKFNILARKASALNQALIRGGHLYTPEWNDPLSSDPVVNKTLEATKADIIAEQWKSTVLSHPGLWLKSRAEIFSWLFLPDHKAQCRPYYVGANGDPEFMHALGMKRRFDGRDRALFAYGKNSYPVFNHALFAGLAILALIALLWRRRAEDLAIAGLLGGTILFTASFYAISIACDYRYLYALDFTTMAALIWLAADFTMPKRSWPKKTPGKPVPTAETDDTHTVLPFRRPDQD